MHIAFEKMIDPNWVIAISAVITAVFTVVLGLFTVSVAKSTRIAANAADRSARAATRIELPVIRIVPPEIGSPTDRDPNKGYGIIQGWRLSKLMRISRIEFRNRGRTHADPTDISLGWRVAQHLDGEPGYTWTEKIEPGTALRPDIGQDIELSDFFFELTDVEVRAVNNRQLNLWLFGRLNYLDFMGDKHEHRFCWRWDSQERQMRPYRLFTDPETPGQYIRSS
jgi:hypothetical protein